MDDLPCPLPASLLPAWRRWLLAEAAALEAQAEALTRQAKAKRYLAAAIVMESTNDNEVIALR